jgi:DNA mismatch repair protein MutL
MPIHVLPEELAAKIAAGEVIERPASVVKELVENSLDAQARDIRIEVRGGGQRLLRVADDGCGIPAQEVGTAFERHATSKLQSADELFAIRTLGFRGEALPSIAAVARVTLITRAQGDEAGTLYKAEGGRKLAHQPFGAPGGTVVTVEDLFRNVPARLKFLKAPGSEVARIAELVNAFALAYPGVRFTLVNDGRLLFQAHGSGKPADVLVKVFGTEAAREMIEIKVDPSPDREISVTGFISPPAVHRGTRKLEFLFVNGRWVEDRSLAHAIQEAYHTFLMVGRFPLYTVGINLPLDAVDVNVHPTKLQVRFRDPGAVYAAVQRSVRRALTDRAPIPTLGGSASAAGPAGFQPGPNPGQMGRLDDDHATAAVTEFPATAPLPGSGTASGSQMPMLRVIGQIASTYIIAEGPDGLYLVDQHAAHERVLYEQFMAAGSEPAPHAQHLLEPLSLTLSPTQWVAYTQQTAALAHVGFQIEPFGGQSIMVRAVPAILKGREPREALGQVLDELPEGGAPLQQEAEQRLITGVCKSAAIKGGQILSLDEMRALMRDLEKTNSPRTCPHGRPTMIQLNLGQLEREFGRRG